METQMLANVVLIEYDHFLILPRIKQTAHLSLTSRRIDVLAIDTRGPSWTRAWRVVP